MPSLTAVNNSITENYQPFYLPAHADSLQAAKREYFKSMLAITPAESSDVKHGLDKRSFKDSLLQGSFKDSLLQGSFKDSLLQGSFKDSMLLQGSLMEEEKLAASSDSYSSASSCHGSITGADELIPTPPSQPENERATHVQSENENEPPQQQMPASALNTVMELVERMERKIAELEASHRRQMQALEERINAQNEDLRRQVVELQRRCDEAHVGSSTFGRRRRFGLGGLFG